MFRYLFFLAFILSIISCKKDKSSPIPDSSSKGCLVTEIRDSLNILYYSATYNNRILQTIKTYDAGVYVERWDIQYDNDTIRGTYRDSSDVITIQIKYCIGSNGKIDKEFRYIPGTSYNTFDTMYYYYDADNYLIKYKGRRAYRYTSGVISYEPLTEDVYVISNGNIISDSSIGSGYYEKYEYYLDKLNKTEIDIDGVPSFNFNSLFGTPSKNLIKHVYNNKSSDVSDYQYAIDGNGYVTKMFIKRNSGGTTKLSVGNLIYSCH